MTTVLYDPGAPAMEWRGHAGAGAAGGDLVCAALSTLLYTLIAAAPGAETELSEGYARVTGGEAGPYRFAAAGLRLLAADYPRHVRLEVRA